MTLLKAYLELVSYFEMAWSEEPYTASHTPENDLGVVVFRDILGKNDLTVSSAVAQEAIDMIEELHGTYIFSFVVGFGEITTVATIHRRIRENYKTIQRIEDEVYNVCG